MQTKKLSMLIASLALIACMSPAVAQAQDKNDGLAQLVLITARDGQAQALEKAITSYHHYMADKKGAFRYQWYSITTGTDTGKYIARTGDHNWADLDLTHDWDKAAAAKFASEVQPFIASAEFRISRTDNELGIWPDSMEGYQYFSVTDWTIQAGQFGAFNQGLKKIDKILKEAKWPNYYAFIWSVSGGNGNQVTLVIAYKSFADMAPKAPSFIETMRKALGEQEAGAFLSSWGSTYKAGENRLLKFRPKLSDYGDG